MYLNANIPVIDCYVRAEFLQNHEGGFGEVFACIAFGVISRPGEATLFTILLEDGGVWWGVPVSALCWREDAEAMSLDNLQLWNNFSYNVSVTTFAALSNMSCVYTDRTGVQHRGEYLFTIDWAQGDYNELRYGYSETSNNHKCGHVLKLHNGNFAIQPNNRLRFFDPSFTTKEQLVCPRKINTHTYRVENNPKWATEDSNDFYYHIIQRASD
jgi:hypothetical protein